MSAPLRAGLVLLGLLSLGFEWEGRLTRLARLLDTASPTERREAVQELATFPADRAGPSILRALDDVDASVRAEAVRAAGRLRLRDALPKLLDWLDEPDADLRARVADALGRIGATEAVPALVRALGDPTSDVRNAAVVALAAIGAREAVVPILGRLDDADASVRITAAVVLGQMGDPSAVVPLIGRARDESPEVRAAVARALGAIGDRRATAALLQTVGDAQEAPRLAAIGALGVLADPSAVRALVEAAGHSDPRTARAAVAALGAIDHADALDALVRSLARGDVRAIAADRLVALAERGHDGVATTLAERLPRSLPPSELNAVTEALARVLEARPTTSVVPALLDALRGARVPVAPLLDALAATRDAAILVPALELLRSPDPAVQGAAARALRTYFRAVGPDGRAADPLFDALPIVVRDVRPLVVELLGATGASRALSVLEPLLASEDAALRRATVQAIGAIPSDDALPALLALLDDADAEVRDGAAHAVGRTASDATLRALLERALADEPVDRHARLVAIVAGVARRAAAGTLAPALVDAFPVALDRLRRTDDAALATRALDVAAATRSPALTGVVTSALSDRRRSVRRRAAFVLGLLGARDEALRVANTADDPGARLAAAAGASELGADAPIDALFELAEGPWPRSEGAAYALARLANDGRLDAARVPALCRIARTRHPFVHANAVVALAALEAAPCPDGVSPSELLDTRHAPAVRAAAARWLRAVPEGRGLDARARTQRLERCAREELLDRVRAACAGQEATAASEPLDLVAFAPDGRAVLADRLVALGFADGTVLVLHTDVAGRLRVEHPPAGPLVLEDPLTTPLDP